MKRNLLVGALAVAVTGAALWQTSVRGQNRSTTSRFEANVALVDVGHIFKNYTRFTSNSDLLKEEAKEREKQIQGVQQNLKNLLSARNSFKPGTPDHKAKELEIAKKKAEMDLMVDGARKEFQQRESELYHRTFKEIRATIKAVCVRNNITLVLRHTREEGIDPNNPQDVLKEISQQVIYANAGMDITDSILQVLNRGVQPSASRTSGTTRK